MSELARNGAQPAAGSVRGGTLGRYTILEPIGVGAMGIVLAAFDPALDRNVAIKLLRPGDSGTAGRLLREAQAMARVAHPNVIAVHDVGSVDGQDFVAMELVPGGSLDAWLRKRSRTTAEVLDVFVQAARGLAAAHEAGLVHRDFKPANVLVGDDGRARVTDFGLARADATGHAIAGAALPATSLAGTPAYMAPEQLAGEVADARADQFAFCVALWESLAGARPFAGESVDELRAEIAAGRIKPRAGMRPRVERALRRGLSPIPAARFASMHELIAAVAHPARRSRPWLIGAVAALAIGAVVALVATKQRGSGDAGERDLGLMIPAHVQSARAARTGAVASVEVALPRAQTAGDLDVVVVTWNDATANVSSIRDRAGNAYARVGEPARIGAISQVMYFAPAIRGGANALTATFDVDARDPDVRVLEFSGVALRDPVVASAQRTGTGTLAASGALDLATSPSLLVAAGAGPRGLDRPGAELALDAASGAALSAYGVVRSTGPREATAALDGGAWLFQAVAFRARDDRPPRIHLVHPDGPLQELAGEPVWLQADADDNVHVTEVDMFLDDARVCRLTAPPYACEATPRGIGAHTFHAEARDGAGNVATSVATVIDIAAPPVVENVRFPAQRGAFAVDMDVTPSGQPHDVVIGLATGPATAYTDAAAIVRFSNAGVVDVRNGASYGANAWVGSIAGREYHVRMEVDVPHRTYSVFVTPAGETEIALARNFAFRDSQPHVRALADRVKLTSPGDAAITGFRITPR